MDSSFLFHDTSLFMFAYHSYYYMCLLPVNVKHTEGYRWNCGWLV